MIDENKAEQIVHKWYSRDNCEVACEADLKDNWIGDSLLNLIINVICMLRRAGILKITVQCLFRDIDHTKSNSRICFYYDIGEALRSYTKD